MAIPASSVRVSAADTDALAPVGPFQATHVTAPGVRKIARLHAFLPECARLSATGLGCDSVAGWGARPTALRARRSAERRGLPYLHLEDGFFRSIGLGESGAAPVSLIVDDLGLPFDATRPNRLEQRLATTGWESPALIARARALMDRIVQAGLSKTNAAPPLAPGAWPRTPGRRRVLVVDQTAGDASIRLGLADAGSFARMLQAALTEEDGAEVVVRRHPATVAGLKAGSLPAELSQGVMLAPDARAGDVLGEVDAVYTVSSGLGFEALVRGLPVRTFGLPFYAGWGATRDELASVRRTRRRSPEELFVAAVLLYARYVDPVTGERCEAESAIERLIALRARADANAGFTACVGFDPWKRAATRTWLYSPRGQTAFFREPERAAETAARRGGRVVTWAGRESAALHQACERHGAPLTRMEDGFVRSRGLGSAFHRAWSLTQDSIGVHYDPSSPSALESLLQAGDFPPALLRRAAALRRRLVAQGFSKYNLAGRPPPALPADRFKLLVVGQVEDDRSVLLGCLGPVRTNAGLLEAARHAHPDALILYKPHPDVEAGRRRGALPAAAALADLVLEHADIAQCLDAVDGVATLTSLAGFEALLRYKPVWTWGGPFYAGWGVTTDALQFPRRTRPLSLDELVAGALLVYPQYLDPISRLPCEPELLLDRLAGGPRRLPGPRRLRLLRGLWHSVRGVAPPAY